MAWITHKRLAIGVMLISLGGAGAWALVHASGSAAQAPEMFTVISRLESANFVNAGGDFLPAGDYSVGRSKVLDEAGASRVGTRNDFCVDLFNGRQLCESVFFIEGRGRLIVEGIFALQQKVAVLAVTGGTGDFVGAGGIARSEPIPGGSGGTRVIFELP